jgi:hypothetical protein
MSIEVGFMFFNYTRCYIGEVTQVESNSISVTWKNKKQEINLQLIFNKNEFLANLEEYWKEMTPVEVILWS